MKKRFGALFLAGLLMCSLTACGGSAGGGSNASSSDSAAADDMPMEEMEYFSEATSDIAMPEEDAGLTDGGAVNDGSVYDSSKLILRGSITAEATDFDAALSAIEQQVAAAGGYIESSSTSGSVGYRWANLVARVPREQFENTFDAVGENCHVTESSRSTENVSASYYDAESRKTALETKRERLLALLKKAENMEDIIALESALSDVQYEIESLSGTLRNYDRLISFSTVEIYLSEVRDLSVIQEEDSFLSDLKTAAVTGTRRLVEFVQGVILAAVYGWWMLLILALIVLLVYQLRKRRKQQASQTILTPNYSAQSDIPQNEEKNEK